MVWSRVALLVLLSIPSVHCPAVFPVTNRQKSVEARTHSRPMPMSAAMELALLCLPLYQESKKGLHMLCGSGSSVTDLPPLVDPKMVRRGSASRACKILRDLMQPRVGQRETIWSFAPPSQAVRPCFSSASYSGLPILVHQDIAIVLTPSNSSMNPDMRWELSWEHGSTAIRVASRLYALSSTTACQPVQNSQDQGRAAVFCEASGSVLTASHLGIFRTTNLAVWQ